MNDHTTISKAIVLAAGQGKRLGAITADRPKPMVPVRGRPILEHILVGLRAAGISDALIVVRYLGHVIVDFFGDGSRLGLRLTYVEQGDRPGSGAALLHGRDFAGRDPFVGSYGDILTDPAHYRALLADFGAEPCAAVLGINPVDDPSAGAAVVREGRRVTRIVEKPPKGANLSNWNQAGVTAYGPELWAELEQVGPSARGEIELTDAVARLIGAGHAVRAVEFGGFWSDVGTPEALAEAEARWEECGAHA